MRGVEKRGEMGVEEGEDIEEMDVWWKEVVEAMKEDTEGQKNVGMCGDTIQGDRDSFENQNNITFYPRCYVSLILVKEKDG